jgi:hypothetical protein
MQLVDYRFKMIDVDKSKLYYLASPYRSFYGKKIPGLYKRLDKAFEAVSELAGQLAAEGVFTFSPIAHSHPIALFSELDATKDEPWYSWNVLLMEKMEGMIVAKFPGWDESKGIKFEIEYYKKNNKEVYYLDI